jgi:tetratricopeptide (TPR) repeat protein
MLGMYGLGTQELIIAGVVLVVLVFAPFLFAFARAGFRHPLLTAIPVSIAVFLVVALAAGFTGVNALAILAIIAIAAIVYGFSQSVIRTSDNESNAPPRKAYSAANEASTLEEAQPTDLSEDVSGQVAEKASLEISLSPSTSGPSAPKPLLLPVSRLFARGREAFTKRPETLEIAAFFAMVGSLMLIGVIFQGIITPPQMGTLTERIKQAEKDSVNKSKGLDIVDEREKAIIDRHKTGARKESLFQEIAHGEADLEIDARRQQRAYAEKPPTTIAQITVDPTREMLLNLGDRRQVLGIIHKMTPEQRDEALKLATGIAQQFGDDRGGFIARCVAAFSRGVTHGWVNPIMELVGIGGTEKEIQFIRQLDEIAAQEFHPYRPGDQWFERMPLQAIEMLPRVFVIGGLIFIAYRWKARSAQMKHAEASTPTVVPGRDSSSEIYTKPGNAMLPSDSAAPTDLRKASEEQKLSKILVPLIYAFAAFLVLALIGIAILASRNVGLSVSEGGDESEQQKYRNPFQEYTDADADARSHYLRGLGAAQTHEDFESAVQQFTEAIRIDPDYAEAYVARGCARLHNFNEFSLAIEDHTRAINLQPEHPFAYFHRADTYWEEGQDYLEALNDCNKAISLSPGFAHAFWLRSQVLTKLEEHARAKFDLERAEQLGFVGDGRWYPWHDESWQYRQTLKLKDFSIEIPDGWVSASGPELREYEKLMKSRTGMSKSYDFGIQPSGRHVYFMEPPFILGTFEPDQKNTDEEIEAMAEQLNKQFQSADPPEWRDSDSAVLKHIFDNSTIQRPYLDVDTKCIYSTISTQTPAYGLVHAVTIQRLSPHGKVVLLAYVSDETKEELIGITNRMMSSISFFD